MKATLHNHYFVDDETGTEISNREQLVAAIDRFAAWGPACHELIGENGYALMMGIGPTLGCVQHSHTSGDPPYLMAMTPESARSGDGHIEFMMGGTPTPIPRRNCLPLDVIKEVAVHFLETGERSDAVQWGEV